MKRKKLVFLTLALLLPVAVFVFLKIFGRNEFTVPVMHQEGMIEAPANCDFTYETPYLIPDSLVSDLNFQDRDSVYVFYFDPSLTTPMNRISVEFKWASVKVVTPSDFHGRTDLRSINDCVLLIPPEASVALVDHKNRIRGYYDGTDRDEVDRLIVEIKIILKQY